MTEGTGCGWTGRWICCLALLICGLTTIGPPATHSAGQYAASDFASRLPSTTQTCTGFYDDFASPTLGSGWTWINEDRWSLAERPDFLRISSEHTEDDPTYLMREAPSGIRALWTHLEVEPAAVLQLAGIVIYQDENNWLRLARQSGGDQAVFYSFSRYLDDDIQVEYVTTDATAARSTLRIRREADQWIGEYALPDDSNSTEWTAVGRFTSDFPTPRVGLVATAPESGDSPVDFDDFCLEPPDAGTPTPTATPPRSLTLTGLVYDATVGPARGIPGATVSVLMCVPRRFEIRSGSDGRYALLVPGEYLNQCDEVMLEAWAAGYQAFSQSVTVSNLRAQPERDFALAPLPHIVYLPLVSKSSAPPPPPPPPPILTPTPTAEHDAAPGRGTDLLSRPNDPNCVIQPISRSIFYVII